MRKVSDIYNSWCNQQAGENEIKEEVTEVREARYVNVRVTHLGVIDKHL